MVIVGIVAAPGELVDLNGDPINDEYIFLYMEYSQSQPVRFVEFGTGKPICTLRQAVDAGRCPGSLRRTWSGR